MSKHLVIGLRWLLVICFFLSLQSSNSLAQGDKVRKSLKASVSQTLGVDTEVTIVYSRPGVKGRKIWGELVPYGMAAALDSDKSRMGRGSSLASARFCPLVQCCYAQYTGDCTIIGSAIPCKKLDRSSR